VPDGALEPGRQQELLSLKLAALARDHAVLLGIDASASPSTTGSFPGGAARTDGTTATVLAGSDLGIGASLAWAAQHGADRVHLLVDDPALAGRLARLAGHLAQPPTVWIVQGRELSPAGPAPVPEVVAPPAAAWSVAGELEAAGLEVVAEHGVVRGEVEGLEVAVVRVDDDGARIEVGVGRHDREAFAMVHGDLAPADAIRTAADAVRAHRRPGAEPHPLNRLAASRWLRARLLAQLAAGTGPLAGSDLVAVPGVDPAPGVDSRAPALALGRDPQGAPVVVACSVGVDLELVPVAADGRAALDPDARLVLVVPARDAVGVTTRLASALARPAEVLPVEGDWRA
jgi:hypothetical protein